MDYQGVQETIDRAFGELPPRPVLDEWLYRAETAARTVAEVRLFTFAYFLTNGDAGGRIVTGPLEPVHKSYRSPLAATPTLLHLALLRSCPYLPEGRFATATYGGQRVSIARPVAPNGLLPLPSPAAARACCWTHWMHEFHGGRPVVSQS